MFDGSLKTTSKLPYPLSHHLVQCLLALGQLFHRQFSSGTVNSFYLGHRVEEDKLHERCLLVLKNIFMIWNRSKSLLMLEELLFHIEYFSHSSQNFTLLLMSLTENFYRLFHEEGSSVH